MVIFNFRHHTRFIPAHIRDRNMRRERDQNIQAGTVVEKDVTNKTDFDFYLCSHQGIQVMNNSISRSS